MYTCQQSVQSIITNHYNSSQTNCMQGEYCFKNQKKRGSLVMLDELYQKILTNFIERLYKENRFRTNGLDDHALYFLEKRVRELLKDPKKLFELANNYQEGTQWFRKVEANIVRQDRKDLTIIKECREHKLIQGEMEDKKASNVSIDEGHLKQAEPASPKSIKVYEAKKDEKTASMIEAEMEEEENSDSQVSIESEDIQYDQFLANRFVGQFQQPAIKFNWRQERYNIHFTNVFCKTQEGEIYFPNFLIDMKKMNKLKLQSLGL